MPQPAPTALALLLASDSGVLGDGITADATPTITGLATAGTMVTLYDGTLELGTAIADAGGGFSITTGLLADGAHLLTATATNSSGIVSEPALALALLVDTQAPAAPTALALHPWSETGAVGDGLTFDTTPTITGMAEAGGFVTFYDGMRDLGSVKADAYGHWELTSDRLPIGSYALTARQMDAAGNVSAASAPLLLDIDNGTPGRPVILGIADDTDTPGDGITMDHAPTIFGTAVPLTTVRLFLDGHLLDTVVADADGDWATAPLPVSEGLHSLSADLLSLAGLHSFLTDAEPLLVYSGHLITLPGQHWGEALDGTPQDDFILLDGSNNSLTGGGGDDTLMASGWGNALTGGDGNDSLSGGAGNSTIIGGDGDNHIVASGWNNVITSGDGADTIDGGEGYASIETGDGDKAISVDGWGDHVVAGDGTHVLTGPQGEAVVEFGDGDATIVLAGWDNSITVGAGHHSITAGQGAATVVVTGVADTSAVILLDGFGNAVTSQAAGTTTVSGSQGFSVIATGTGNDVVFAAGFVNTVTTGAGNDEIHLSAGNALVNGGTGSDLIWLAGGNNLVQLGQGDGVEDVWGFDAAAGDVVDTLGFAGAGVVGFSQAGDYALLTIGGQDLARFHGYGAGDLSALAASIW